MEAVLAALRPKLGTFSQGFHSALYDILLVESSVNDKVVKRLPKVKLSFEEDHGDSLCKVLYDITGADLGGIKGKRAMFIPSADSEALDDGDQMIRGTLYCVPVNTEDKLDAKYVDNLPGLPGFYSLDLVLKTLLTKPATYNRQTCIMLRRLESWLTEKHSVPGAISLLFSPSTEDRIKRSICNPAFFSDHQFSYTGGSSDMETNFSQTLANEALARMMEIEKCDIIKINTLFGQDLPFRTQVDAFAVNRFWGKGKPDYTQMKVPDSPGQHMPRTSAAGTWVTEYPVHKCAYEGDTAGIRRLIKMGCDVQAADQDNWYPVHYAAWFGHLQAIDVLLTEGGCSPNVTNTNGSTPLHLAASRGLCYVIELLLNHKDIDVSALDNYEESALDLCENVDQADWQDAAKLLRNAMSRPTPTIQVFLMDGMSRMLNLVSAANTTVQQLHQQMLKELNVPDTYGNLFTIWICSRNLQLQLKPEHKPIQHLNDWKRKIVQLLTNWDPSREDPQLFWRRHASLTIQNERMVRNPAAINLLFHEAYHNYIKCLYPCSNEDAVIMGGILMQLHHGDYDQRKARSYFSGDHTLKKLIPECKLRDKTQNWVKELQAQYKHFSQAMISRDRSPHILQYQFLRVCWNLTLYGSAFFTGYVPIRNARSPSPVYIGVNDLGIHIISVQTKSMLQTFAYEAIDWRRQGEDPVLEIKLKSPARGGTHIITKQAGLVDHLMRKLSQLNLTNSQISL